MLTGWFVMEVNELNIVAKVSNYIAKYGDKADIVMQLYNCKFFFFNQIFAKLKNKSNRISFTIKN